MKIAILPKNIECCDGLARKRRNHHKGATFVVVFALTGRACALVYHVRR